MTLEEIIAKINGYGFSINNLFQFEDFWRCNFRDDNTHCFFDFAQGSSIREALEKALAKAKEEHARRRIAREWATIRHKKEATPSFEDML